MARTPFPVPLGWFSAGYSGEFPAGSVERRHYVGRELVVWRDTDGGAHVHDAYCPHLGAHLGVGGTVDGCELVCPFHGWRYDADGRNSAIPYSERTNGKARIRTYPVVERNGMVFFWWHPDPAVEPQWEVPDLTAELGDDGADTVEWAETYEWTVHTAWQEVAENAFDMAHFMFVHGLSEPGELGDYEFDGPFRRGSSAQKFNTSKGVFDGTISSTSYGPGLGVTRFHVVGHATLVSTPTPVERDVLCNRFAWRYADDDVSRKVGPMFSAEVKRQFEQDKPIWEHKIYKDPPALAAPERAIAEFRRWARQFYAEPLLTDA